MLRFFCTLQDSGEVDGGLHLQELPQKTSSLWLEIFKEKTLELSFLYLATAFPYYCHMITEL